MSSAIAAETIGLIAGNGSFPLLFAQEARRRGTRVVAVALKEEADPAIEQSSDVLAWYSIGQIGKTIEFFKNQGVSKAIMAGQVKHTQLFRDIIPDFRAVKMLARLANKKAESLLGAVVSEFQSEGIEFLSSATYLEHWLAPEGRLTQRAPTQDEETDIQFGLQIARSIAAQDIGQTVAVKEKSIVAVEAMEGTDACIRRAGEIAGPGCVIVKVARPKQDLRFDIPIVGQRTLDSLQAAGARVLAVEAGKTLLLNKDELLNQANGAKLTLTGLRP